MYPRQETQVPSSTSTSQMELCSVPDVDTVEEFGQPQDREHWILSPHPEPTNRKVHHSPPVAKSGVGCRPWNGVCNIAEDSLVVSDQI